MIGRINAVRGHLSEMATYPAKSLARVSGNTVTTPTRNRKVSLDSTIYSAGKGETELLEEVATWFEWVVLPWHYPFFQWWRAPKKPPWRGFPSRWAAAGCMNTSRDRVTG